MTNEVGLWRNNTKMKKKNHEPTLNLSTTEDD